MKQKILFIGCTHGDEKVGMWLFNTLPYGRKKDLTWDVIIGNPKALFLNKRFTEDDLNRSFNLSQSQQRNTYEHKRARELAPHIQKYDVVYDIHQTQPNMKDCIFINTINDATLHALKPLAQKYVVIDDHPDYSKHFITSVAPVGITIEYAYRESHQQDIAVLEKDFNSIINAKYHKAKKIFLRNYKALPRNKTHSDLQFENFKKLTDQQKKRIDVPQTGTYYPMFIDVYPDYYCFLTHEVTV
jgi:succinylglutamate desuccinylase